MLYTKSLNGMLVFARTADTPYLMAAFYGASFGGMIVVALLASVLTNEPKHTGRSPGYLAASPATTGSASATHVNRLPSMSSEKIRASWQPWRRARRCR